VGMLLCCNRSESDSNIRVRSAYAAEHPTLIRLSSDSKFLLHEVIRENSEAFQVHRSPELRWLSPFWD
jgi:hypothetical protein